MHIVLLHGSPHQQGTSALLADAFAQGAEEAGHTIFRFAAAFADVHPCRGCDTCRYGNNPCVFRDDMDTLYSELQKADMVVFASPLYYHCMSSQLRTVIDRFRGINAFLKGSGKKTLLLMTGASTVPTVFDGAVTSYRETAKYLGWQDCGVLCAFGCPTRSDIEQTDYPAQALALGRNLGSHLSGTLA